VGGGGVGGVLLDILLESLWISGWLLLGMAGVDILM